MVWSPGARTVPMALLSTALIMGPGLELLEAGLAPSCVLIAASAVGIARGPP